MSDSWTTRLADAKRFNSKDEAQARLEQVGEVAWGCKVLDKCVGAVSTGGEQHPIVLVEVEIMDGSGSRLFLYRDG